MIAVFPVMAVIPVIKVISSISSDCNVSSDSSVSGDASVSGVDSVAQVNIVNIAHDHAKSWHVHVTCMHVISSYMHVYPNMPVKWMYSCVWHMLRHVCCYKGEIYVKIIVCTAHLMGLTGK